MSRVKISSRILHDVSLTNSKKLWRYVFESLSHDRALDSINALLGEHGFYLILGAQGVFSQHANHIEVEFKEEFDSWCQGLLEEIEDSDEFSDEVTRIYAEAEKWFLNWIRYSLRLPAIKEMKTTMLGRRRLSLWMSESEADFEKGKHKWIGGTRL